MIVQLVSSILVDVIFSSRLSNVVHLLFNVISLSILDYEYLFGFQDIAALKEEANYNKNKAEEWKNTAQSLEDSLNLSEQERQGKTEM